MIKNNSKDKLNEHGHTKKFSRYCKYCLGEVEFDPQDTPVLKTLDDIFNKYSDVAGGYEVVDWERARQAISELIATKEREARIDVANKIVNEIDGIELSTSETDTWKLFKLIRNTIRDKFKLAYGVDPSPNKNYDVFKSLGEAELRNTKVENKHWSDGFKHKESEVEK